MKSPGFTIVEAVVAVSILAIIGSFSYVWLRQQNRVSSTLQSSTSASIPSPYPTMRLKMYTNKKYGYSLQIPSSWIDEESYYPNSNDPQKYQLVYFSEPKINNYHITIQTYGDSVCGSDNQPLPNLNLTIEQTTHTATWLCDNMFKIEAKMNDGLIASIVFDNDPVTIAAVESLININFN